MIRIAIDLVRERRGVDIDINNMEPEDKATYEMIREGKTFGVFQLSSSGMSEVFKGLEHVNFDSLIAGVSLYRPGPMENIPEYQDRANGIKPVNYPSEELEEILKPTFGIMVYQEQLMQTTQKLGGYTAGQADSFRKATGKKSQKVMDEELPKLHKAILEHGHPESLADHVIELIKPFVGYGFNKSHAAAYALIAFQTAYLKCHYSTEFFTALMTVFASDKTKLAGYVQDAKSFGIKVLLPDVNRSQKDFHIIDDHTILYGFDSIKGLPVRAVDSIMEKRPFKDLADLIDRNENKLLNKKAVDVLSLSGALDSMKGALADRRAINALLYQLRGDADKIDSLPAVFNHKVTLEYEKELLGVYLSGHPLDNIAKPIDWEAAEGGAIVKGHAMLSGLRRITTKKGDPMAFLTLEFIEQTVEAVCFPHVYSREKEFRKGEPLVPIGDLIKEGMVVKVVGQFEENYRGEQSFFIRDISIPVRLNKDSEEHIERIQGEIGIEQVIEEPVDAPSMTLDDVLNS